MQQIGRAVATLDERAKSQWTGFIATQEHPNLLILHFDAFWAVAHAVASICTLSVMENAFAALAVIIIFFIISWLNSVWPVFFLRSLNIQKGSLVVGITLLLEFILIGLVGRTSVVFMCFAIVPHLFVLSTTAYYSWGYLQSWDHEKSI